MGQRRNGRGPGEVELELVPGRTCSSERTAWGKARRPQTGGQVWEQERAAQETAGLRRDSRQADGDLTLDLGAFDRFCVGEQPGQRVMLGRSGKEGVGASGWCGFKETGGGTVRWCVVGRTWLQRHTHWVPVPALR